MTEKRVHRTIDRVTDAELAVQILGMLEEAWSRILFTDPHDTAYALQIEAGTQLTRRLLRLILRRAPSEGEMASVECADYIDDLDAFVTALKDGATPAMLDDVIIRYIKAMRVL